MQLDQSPHKIRPTRVPSSKQDRKTFKWDDASKDLAREMLKSGATFSTVAAEIGVSRCAIAGIARRLGISKTQAEETHVRKLRKQAKEAAKPKAVKQQPRPIVLTPIVEPADLDRPKKAPVALSDLRARHCRCVVGHDGREPLFCGETVVPNYSWCPTHKAQFIVPSKYQTGVK